MKWQSQICDDEIIRDWSLNSVGISFVRKFRKQYQLWIYLQVCGHRQVVEFVCPKDVDIFTLDILRA